MSELKLWILDSEKLARQISALSSLITKGEISATNPSNVMLAGSFDGTDVCFSYEMGL